MMPFHQRPKPHPVAMIFRANFMEVAHTVADKITDSCAGRGGFVHVYVTDSGLVYAMHEDMRGALQHLEGKQGVELAGVYNAGAKPKDIAEDVRECAVALSSRLVASA